MDYYYLDRRNGELSGFSNLRKRSNHLVQLPVHRHDAGLLELKSTALFVKEFP